MFLDREEQLNLMKLTNQTRRGLPLAGRGAIRAFVLLMVVSSAALTTRAEAPEVLAGVDVLRRDDFSLLAGQRVGLITNHTGLTRDGVSTVDLLHRSPEVDLRVLFSPEHGFRGQLDVSKIADAKDPETGLTIYSLYGETRRPTAAMLQDIDTIVFDIQDIGTRFYTYVSTMGEAMKAAAEHDKRFVVLDRPNPIGGVKVSGPMLDPGKESFVAFHPLPVRHGMTIAELARMFRDELQLQLRLDVVACEGWQRNMRWDETDLLWVNPSPNMRSLTQAMLYPGIGMLETTNLSVGRGTDTPFEWIGAPWIDPIELANHIRRQQVAGVTVIPRKFTPQGSKYAGETCGGLRFMIVDPDAFEPINLGLVVAHALATLYPEQWNCQGNLRLVGNEAIEEAIATGQSIERLKQIAGRGVDEFLQRRASHLLYPR